MPDICSFTLRLELALLVRLDLAVDFFFDLLVVAAFLMREAEVTTAETDFLF